jgi:hypothetical protein
MLSTNVFIGCAKQYLRPEKASGGGIGERSRGNSISGVWDLLWRDGSVDVSAADCDEWLSDCISGGDVLFNVLLQTTLNLHSSHIIQDTHRSS